MPFNVGVAYSKAPCTKEFALRILSIFTSRTRNPSRTRTRRISSAAGCGPMKGIVDLGWVPRQSEADHCTGSLGWASREKSEDVVGGLARLRRRANNGAIVLA